MKNNPFVKTESHENVKTKKQIKLLSKGEIAARIYLRASSLINVQKLILKIVNETCIGETQEKNISESLDISCGELGQKYVPPNNAK